MRQLKIKDLNFFLILSQRVISVSKYFNYGTHKGLNYRTNLNRFKLSDKNYYMKVLSLGEIHKNIVQIISAYISLLIKKYDFFLQNQTTLLV